MKKKVILDGLNLSLEDFIAITRFGAEVEIEDVAIHLINESRSVVEEFVNNNEVVYGITTGFGNFANVVISKEESKKLQRNLIISHAVGCGNPFSTEIVRGIMLLRVNNLVKGYSGIRYDTINTLVEMLNKGVHPVIPEKGSLGASGDLVPLAHMTLPMIGLGSAELKGEVMKGAKAMITAGISMVELTAKEGLALINGTQAMTSVGTHVIYDAIQLMDIADLAAAMTFEGLLGITTALDARVHQVRPHRGQISTAKNLLHYLKGSEMTTAQGEVKVQDAYSLRCTPQIHGASRDAINYVKETIEIEMNAVTDNPIIFGDTKEGISSGNFHGQPVALACDFLGIALAEIANVSERRLERLVNPALSGLPAFLVEDGGVNSGFMIVQYSAAALVSENKILAHPASVDSIPSSANQEDHVSMGTIAARKALEIFKNARRVVAMELMCGAQAIDLRGKKQLGYVTEPTYEAIRNKVTRLITDRELYDDINACENLIIDGDLASIINSHRTADFESLMVNNDFYRER